MCLAGEAFGWESHAQKAIGGFAMALYVPLTLFINYRYLPKAARPGAISTVMMVVASLTYIVFAVACLLWEFGLV